jgi:putative hemolysin
MKRNKILVTLAFTLAAILFLPACASEQPNQVITAIPTETEHLPDMANPAAVYCEGLGYSMESVTRDGGQDADCIFSDGSRCAQWDFLAGRCGQAFTFCKMQGFELEVDTNIGICRFPDGSYCDEYQYFSGECSPGDNPGVAAEEPTQISDVSKARDYLAAYFDNQFGIQVVEPWIEQNITPTDAIGSSTIRYVSGPMTIVISAEASAPSPVLYTIEEASYIANGFYWEGTLSYSGELFESTVIPPGTILSEVDAREAVMEYILTSYDVPPYGEWTDQGISQTETDTVVRVYTSGPWVVEVELVPAAPLVSSYHVTADHLQEEIRWEGDISYHGDITESDFSK